jgi:Methyltransferase domain
MAHYQQRIFVEFTKSRWPEYFQNRKVIEIGSLDINGTVSDLFQNCAYLGVDVGLGKGVNLVSEGQNLNFADNSFDVAISVECFEHNPHWLETFTNMHRMAESLVIFTCASTGRPEHGTTRTDAYSSPLTEEWNYYKNLDQSDFSSNLPLAEMFSSHEFIYNAVTCDLYFWGFKAKNK